MSYIPPQSTSPRGIELSKKQKSYVDISLSFEPNPITSDLTLLKNERAINNSLKNIIMFIPLEVVFQRDIGSQVTNYLFDLVDEGTAGLLEVEIKRAIEFCEPRVFTTEVKVTPNIDANQFEVDVYYKIIGTDQIFYVDLILIPTR
tara:strand:- start:200 stop:637 length:438 start_codon:yes stop_codon:yes gene_type:complete